MKEKQESAEQKITRLKRGGCARIGKQIVHYDKRRQILWRKSADPEYTGGWKFWRLVHLDELDELVKSFLYIWEWSQKPNVPS